MEGSPPSTDESHALDGASSQNGGWALPVLLLLVLAGVAIYAFSRRPPDANTDSSVVANWKPAPQPAGETVQLVIDFGNGARREFDSLPWTPEMTVVDVLEAAQTFRPGIRYTQRGTGASGFLSSLEGVENEGGQGRKRNWRFLIDGKLGESSFCLAQVEPGSSILWEYTAEY